MLASAFSTEVGRLRDAGSEMAAAAAAGGEDGAGGSGMVIDGDGDGEAKAGVRAARYCVIFRKKSIVKT